MLVTIIIFKKKDVTVKVLNILPTSRVFRGEIFRMCWDQGGVCLSVD